MHTTTPLLGLVAVLLAACTSGTDYDPPPLSEPRGDAPETTLNASPAPSGFEASLIATRSREPVLRLRTVGSGSCFFEIDEVDVMDDVVEVTDESEAADDRRPCTADSQPSVRTYGVPAQQAEAFDAASIVVVRLSSGQRFSMPLLPGME